VWNADRLICLDNEGNSRIFITSWTDYPPDEPENPYKGTVDFWFEDLQMLTRVISDAEKM
jgi:hypothetical protein